MQGLLSGIGHPVIGLDHFAFVVALGIDNGQPGLAAAFMRTVWACAAGCGRGHGGGLPVRGGLRDAADGRTGCGAVRAAARRDGAVRTRASGPCRQRRLFAFAGLFHGAAYGAAVIGAETTPIVAYLIGFSAVQMAIALAAAGLVRGVWKAASAGALQPRLTGAVCAGVGLVFTVEALEGVLLG